MSAIAFDKVSIAYGGQKAVREVTLSIPDGAYCCLVGPSGCGKTSLLRALAGFIEPAAGSISIDGQKVNGVYPGDRNLAMIFQNFALYPHLTVRENFAFPLKAARKPAAEIEAQMQRVAAMLRMEDLLDRYPRELSGGQQQRVAIGRALMRTVRAFLLDEPLGNLDAKLKTGMRTHLRQLHDEVKATFVHVTHDQTEALALADLIVVMNEGKIEQVGTPEQLYERPDTVFVAGFIGTPPMNLIEGALREESLSVGFKAQGIELDLATRADTFRRGVGRRILLGIRPEHLLVGTATATGLRAKVVVVEFAGKECVLDLVCGPHALRARVERDGLGGTVKPGDDVAIRIPTDRVLAFDAESGRRIG
jgi:multiple sugar transport system ATP-binding protein